MTAEWLRGLEGRVLGKTIPPERQLLLSPQHPSSEHLADRLQMTDPAGAARLWTKVDREITDLAPWVPFVSLRFADFMSARVGNYGYNPAWGILLDQLWVE